MALQNITFTIRKLLNRDRNKWPVTVWKLVRRGENWEWQKDRGRRTVDKKQDEEKYQFLREPGSTASISYEYLFQGPGGHDTLIVAKPENNTFVPVKPELEISKDETDMDVDWGNLSEEDIDMNMFVNMGHFIKVAKNELERHYEITKSEDSQWYKAPIVWLVGGAVGMGIFFVLAGIGAQKALAPAAEASSNLLPLIGLKTRNAWKLGE